ncbi:MAG: GGDEF domain-containing protein [Clostridia bacterium]|nr:GGDEF domain-containing protein [Clostridia bacterium]
MVGQPASSRRSAGAYMDNLTLVAANAFIQLYTSVNLLVISFQRKSKPLRFISLGYLILALAFFVVYFFNQAPVEVLALIFNLSFSLFFFMYFAGTRSFCGFKAWPVKYSLLLTLGYALLIFVIILVPVSFPRIAITSLLVVYLFGDFLVTVWPVWQRLRPVEKTLSLVGLIGYPGYLMARLVVIYRDAYVDKFMTDASMESTVTQLFMMVNFSILASVAYHINNRLLLSDLQQKNQLLEEQSITDQLTGLYNRRYLEQMVSREIIRGRNDQQHQDSRQPISLILLDIDAFATINDRHGVHKGNQVLREMAEMISGAADKQDIVVRLAASKFLIVLLEKSKHEALMVAENLRHQIETIPEPLVCPYTASLGVAEHETGENFEHWLGRAMLALDQAKQNGRNRVVSAA